MGGKVGGEMDRERMRELGRGRGKGRKRGRMRDFRHFRMLCSGSALQFRVPLSSSAFWLSSSDGPRRQRQTQGEDSTVGFGCSR